MDAVLFACLAGALLGLLKVSVRVALRRAPDIEASAFVMTVVGLGASTAIALLFGFRPADFDPGKLWPFFAIGAVVPGVARLLHIRAVRDVGAARTGILLGTAPLLSALIAVAVFHEPLRAGLAAGTLLIVAGGFALAWDRSRPAEWKALGGLLALVVALLIGIRDNVARWATGESHVDPVLAIVAVLAAASVVMLISVLLGGQGRAVSERLRGALLPFLPIGLITSIASLLVLEALARGAVSVVAPLIATQVLWVVAFSALLIRRHEAVGRRLVLAALLVVAGAILVGATQ